MDPLILNIETATNICSVSLSSRGELMNCQETTDKNSHAEVLTSFIQQLLADANVSLTDLSAIAISEGPGSYTGLRIGTSVAKGLCFSLNIPLISISTLKSMAVAAVEKTDEKMAMYCPLMDARRMEVYTAIYDYKLNIKLESTPLILESNSFEETLEKHPVYFFGSGVEKTKEIIQHPNAHFIDVHDVSAIFMTKLSFDKYQAGDFVDIPYFEPNYLKNYHLDKRAK